MEYAEGERTAADGRGGTVVDILFSCCRVGCRRWGGAGGVGGQSAALEDRDSNSLRARVVCGLCKMVAGVRIVADWGFGGLRMVDLVGGIVGLGGLVFRDFFFRFE